MTIKNIIQTKIDQNRLFDVKIEKLVLERKSLKAIINKYHNELYKTGSTEINLEEKTESLKRVTRELQILLIQKIIIKSDLKFYKNVSSKIKKKNELDNIGRIILEKTVLDLYFYDTKREVFLKELAATDVEICELLNKVLTICKK